MTKFDMVTVTHGQELMALKLQARSIRKFVNSEIVNSVVVVSNELNGDAFQDAFFRYVLPEYGLFRSRVTLIKRQEIFSGFEYFHGWRTQQVLKLMIVSKSNADYCLVLDSKNHFVRNIDAGSYLAASGKLISSYIDQRGHLQEFFINSFKYFQVDPNKFIERTLPNVTPLPLRVDTVKNMIALIEGRESKSFVEFFLVWPALYAEFYLIAGYIAARDGGLDKEYQMNARNYVTLFPDKANDGDLQSIMFDLAKKEALAFGIHWGARPLLTSDHKHLIAKLWSERGLITELKEAEMFLF